MAVTPIETSRKICFTDDQVKRLGSNRVLNNGVKQQHQRIRLSYDFNSCLIDIFSRQLQQLYPHVCKLAAEAFSSDPGMVQLVLPKVQEMMELHKSPAILAKRTVQPATAGLECVAIPGLQRALDSMQELIEKGKSSEEVGLMRETRAIMAASDRYNQARMEQARAINSMRQRLHKTGMADRLLGCLQCYRGSHPDNMNALKRMVSGGYTCSGVPLRCSICCWHDGLG